jgi:hypothetical protein
MVLLQHNVIAIWKDVVLEIPSALFELVVFDPITMLNFSYDYIQMSL